MNPCAARVVLAVAVCSGLLACRSPEVTVEYAWDDPHAFTRTERRAIEAIAERTVPDVRRLLPSVPRPVVLMVRSGANVIPETGTQGEHGLPNVVLWTVDASRGEGIVSLANAQLRATLFHELHHVVRAQTAADTRLRDHIVREGLATAFERDGAGASPPWGQYPDDVSRWTSEVLALPDQTERAPWLFRHPDGRRWIGYRVGTYLADLATKRSGRTAAELAQVPTDEILRLAGIEAAGAAPHE